MNVKSDRKMLQRKREAAPKEVNWQGVLSKAHETQKGSVGSSIKEMQLYSLNQCVRVAIAPFK